MARQERKRNFRRTVAIVGDGFTEKIYFEQLRDHERLRDVVVKPELPSRSSKGGSYKKALNTAIELAENHTHVYCLIDMDTVVDEGKMADFERDIAKVDKKKITVYINNPCFETWLLVHYGRTGKSFADCDEAGAAVAKHIADYSKNQEYVRKKNLYKLLRPLLEGQGIPNAEFLEKDRDDKGNRYPRAEVYKFFHEEKIVIKTEAGKVRQKGKK